MTRIERLLAKLETFYGKLPSPPSDPFSLHLTHHGATTCTEADPHCPVCPLLTECPEGQRLGRAFRAVLG